MLYSGDAVTHRMNLEIPPHPSRDVVTIHDTVAWRYPDESAPVPTAAVEAQRAAAVICVSRFGADEVAHMLGVREPIVVANGVDARFYDAAPLTPDERVRVGLPERYILHAGGASRRKNLEALAAAWPRVYDEHPEMRLVLAGPEHPRRTQLFSGLAGAMLTGRLPSEIMPGLVAGAATVVVPSLYEGFGLPALEAMAAKVPVVAADTSALSEVVSGAGILTAPTAEGVLDGLLAAISGESEVQKLVTAGRHRAAEFTWQRSAEAHAAVWNQVA